MSLFLKLNKKKEFLDINMECPEIFQIFRTGGDERLALVRVKCREYGIQSRTDNRGGLPHLAMTGERQPCNDRKPRNDG